MVSSKHEAMHRLFRSHPEVFGRAFETLDLPFPEPRGVALLPNDLTEIEPIERRVDTLLRIETDEGPFLLLVEAQSRNDCAKPSSWAYYLSHVNAKYKVPPVLLVVCQDAATARWATGPFSLGPKPWASLTLRPLVLGPHNVPSVTDARVAAEDIPLATLSAITHATDSCIDEILAALVTALQGIDKDDAVVFAELTELGLGDSSAGLTWRKMMTVDLSFFRSETSQRMRAEARAEALSGGVVRILNARGIEVPQDVRDLIANCGDVELLGTWLERAAVATSIADVFTGDR